MKKMRLILTSCLLMTLLSAVHARADLLTDMYGVNISDANAYSDGNTLFQLFNKYFGLDETTGYSSSNDLFNDRGVNPNTTWTTSGSELVGAFKVAAMGHEMSVTNQNGTNLGSIIDVSGTENIHSANGISNLSGSSVQLPDGENVSFQLGASAWGVDSYLWSSDPSANGGLQPNGSIGDDMIHMIALDITDIYNAYFETDFESVYMLCWEDLHLTGDGLGSAADWDYQDFVAIVTNLKPDSSVTPEPSTMLIGLVGGAGLMLVYRTRRTKSLGGSRRRS